MKKSLEEMVAARDARAEQRKAERPGHYIERERVAVVIEKWLAEHRAHNDVTSNRGWGPGEEGHFPSAGAMDTLSLMTGVSLRILQRVVRGSEPKPRHQTRNDGGKTWVVSGGEKYLTIEMVDRLLTGMDMVHLFHLPAEAGGFSDVYLHPSVVDEAA